MTQTAAAEQLSHATGSNVRVWKKVAFFYTLTWLFSGALAGNDKRLLGIAGVVGVYVGLLDDGRTPCLHVMLASDTAELRSNPDFD